MVNEHQFEVNDIEAAKRHDASITAIQDQLKPSGVTHCVNCKDPIELARLCAPPSARTCIDCSQQLEAL